MSTEIHHTAIIDKSIKLGENVSVGAYSIIGANVIVGDNSIIKYNVQIFANTTMGANNIVCSNVVIGEVGQDILADHRRKNETCFAIIGDNNIFYPFSYINCGQHGDKITKIGSNCLFLGQSHVGHDSKIGNGCILSQSTILGGRVELGNYINVGGNTAIHQFCKIGDHAMIGAGITIRKDVFPFFLVAGNPILHYKLNRIGLIRQKFNDERLKKIEEIYKVLKKDIKADLSHLTKSEDLSCIEKYRNKSTRGFYNFLSKNNNNE